MPRRAALQKNRGHLTQEARRRSFMLCALFKGSPASAMHSALRHRLLSFALGVAVVVGQLLCQILVSVAVGS